MRSFQHAFITSLLLFSIGLTPVHAKDTAKLEAKISDLSAMLQVKTATRDKLQKELNAISEELRINSTEKTDLSIEIKQLQLQERKIRLLSDKPSSDQEAELNKLQYKIRIAEIALKKNQQDVKDLSRRKRDIRQRLERLDLLLATKHEQLELLKSQRKLEKQDKKKLERLAAVQRQAAQEKRLQAQLKAQQQQASSERLQAVEASYQKKLLEEKLRRERELQRIKNQNLPAYEAAFNMAKVIAQEPTNKPAAFGDTPKLSIARPVSSKAKHVTDLKHLGNNQYFARIHVRKGRQTFVIDDKTFTRVISPNFDKKECLILVDARGEAADLKLYLIP